MNTPKQWEKAQKKAVRFAGEKLLTHIMHVLEETSLRELKYGGLFDSYDAVENRVEFYVVEGSPPRGYMIVTPTTVLIFEQHGKIVGAFVYWPVHVE